MYFIEIRINGWSDHIVEIKEDYCEQLAGHHWQSICHSIIRVSTSSGISHEELGFGSCTHSKRETALERAMKSAIIDGRNRCLEIFLQNSNTTTNNNNQIKTFFKNINNNINNSNNTKSESFNLKTNSISPKTDSNQPITSFIKSPYDISHIIPNNNKSPLLTISPPPSAATTTTNSTSIPLNNNNHSLDSLRQTPNSQEIRRSVRKSITNINTPDNKPIYSTPPQPIRVINTEENSFTNEEKEQINNDNSIAISQTVPTIHPVIQKNYYQKSPIPTKKPLSPPSSPNHKNPMKRSTIYPIPISNKRLSLGDNKNDDKEDDLDQYLSELGSQTF